MGLKLHVLLKQAAAEGKGPTRNSIVRKKFIFLAHKMDLIIVSQKKACVVPSCLLILLP